MGFIVAGATRPRYYYGSRHDYVYYPDSWTDSNTGTYYEKGYYDENGQYYENVSFEQNGKYENVVCHCDYCGNDVILNLESEDVTCFNLKCPNCTAPLRIVSELDGYISSDDSSGRYSAYSGNNTYRGAQPRKRKKVWPWILAGLLVLSFIGRRAEENASSYQNSGNTQQIQYTDDSVSFGNRIALVSSGANCYSLSDSGAADKTLVWDSDADSYYDAESDCWLWYYSDTGVWQYWYEGVSSDYGDYGWMEHDLDGWYIEASEGNWIPLPKSYDWNSLWYIDG